MVRIGEKFRDERIRRGFTLEEVSRATKIRSSFLLAIEEGKYKKLPQGTYAYGFVRNYARFLGISEHEILALFRREYEEEKFVKVLPDGVVRQDNFSLSKFKITQALKVLPLIFIVLLVYIIFQYRSAIFNPSLNVSTPAENSIVSSQKVTVIGKTDPNVTVFINSDLAVLDKNGNFKKTINVFPGKAKITIKSVNKFNRTTIIERSVEIKI
ncbi:MAG: helix-turn-helix domain-containing protein [Candidatus Levybacteria bacterium]|nr:helix-turn-helix domain-containing protein [Candidatus Levybacteria bacterium]MDZ4228443.1 helix-turn-helix domain-containing protein [Candidatus Levybacteria bacterium]